jgi:hypothetical protein
MKKYIAFGLYEQNEKGGHQEAMGPNDPKPGVAKHVYLADDVEKMLDRMNKTIALFLGPDGEKYVDKFEQAVKDLMEK